MKDESPSQTKIICKKPFEPVEVVIISYGRGSEVCCRYAKKDNYNAKCSIDNEYCGYHSWNRNENW